MYNISEFSKKTNTPIQTLRYYDNLKLLRPNKIGKYNSYRYYSNEELIRIKVIKKLKKMGFSLKEILSLLNEYNEEYLFKQKELLKTSINDNLKSIKEIDKIIGKKNSNLDFQKELVNLLKKEERSDVSMKEQYNSAKSKLLNCYNLYKKDDFEKCLTAVEELKNEIFISINDEGDPFWSNSAGDLFTGITMEVLKNSNIEEINFLNIFYFKINGKELIDDFKEYVDTLDKDSYSYLSLSSVSSAPFETKASIISVFKQKMKMYAMFDTKK